MREPVPTGWFVLRTPLLPIDAFVQWGTGLELPAAGDDPERLAEAWRADRHRLRERLRAIVLQPDVREALFVASPSLDESIEVWLGHPESERGERIERALVRYVSRMTSRSTPFGLFAGCAAGAVGDRTDLLLGSRETYRRRARLDMDYVSRLTGALAADPGLSGRLRYRPNSSLYRAADHFRYVEGRFIDGVRQYWTVSAEVTEPLERTIERAGQGATISALATALVEDDPELTGEEAEEFVRELIDSQILAPELAPPVTGPEPLPRLIEDLRAHDRSAVEILERTDAALSALNETPLGVPPSRYGEIAELLQPLPAEIDPQHLLQIDMIPSMPAATLGPRLIRQLRQSVDVLHRLSRPWDGLRPFREAFLRRYDRREVPLVEALDDETGIGLPLTGGAAASEEASPLLEGIDFPAAASETVQWGHRETFLLQRIAEAQRRGEIEITLAMSDLDAMQGEPPDPLPHAYSVMFTVIPEPGRDLDAGNFRILLHRCATSSGAEPYGRFCHGDPVLADAVRAHLRAEERHRPDAIYAEVVHLPQGRVGNILLRPLLRDYEIPYLGRSGAPEAQQIPVTDLLVSVQGKEVVLRSARLGREVIPRMTNAHGAQGATNLGLYRFLTLLRNQGVASLDWDWGPLTKAPFLPRLVAGRTVLSRARWRVERAGVDPLIAARGVERYRLVQALRRELGLPRYLFVADADRRLPVDLDNALSIDTFAHLIARQAEVNLMEMYPPPDAAVIRGDGGRYAHELCVPFVQAAQEAQEAAGRQAGGLHHTTGRTAAVRRSFPPGSEWLFLKYYGGTDTADRILCQLAPAIREAVATGAARRWFFIRYSDPDWHLRLRLQGDPERLQSEVLPALGEAAEPMVRDGRIWRIALDTYERELERYGGAEGIVASEAVFQADSEAVLAILETLSGDQGLDARWRLALRGIDLLLEDLGLDLPARLALMRRQRETFATELRVRGLTERQLSDKFRRQRVELDALLEPRHEELGEGFDLLAARSVKIRAAVAALRADRAALAASYAHMHANRLLRSAQRAQELVLYDFLTRLYESRQARRAPRKELADAR